MSFIQKDEPENSAYVQLLMLAGYALAGAVISSLIGLAIVCVMYGPETFSSFIKVAGGDPKFVNGLKVIQIFTSLGLFLAPPLFLALTERKKINVFYKFGKPKLELFLLVFLLMVCSMPFMEWITLLNQKMTLPEFLKPVEYWMREKEDEAMQMTITLLTVRTTWDFIVNLFMIALLPAVAEELMFRGGVQRSFYKMFNNHHIAIWIAAFIFSAIHLQFFGFFPRLLLGAAFGYIYFWSGSIWYAMFAHFLNNAYAVGVAWYLQKHNMPLNEADNTAYFKWYGYIISVILTILLFLYFKNKTNTDGKQLD